MKKIFAGLMFSAAFIWLIPSSSSALTYTELKQGVQSGRVLAEQSYETTTLFKSRNLTLSVTPKDFDTTSGKWNYKVSWSRPAGRNGSVYINGNVLAPKPGETTSSTPDII